MCFDQKRTFASLCTLLLRQTRFAFSRDEVVSDFAVATCSSLLRLRLGMCVCVCCMLTLLLCDVVDTCCTGCCLLPITFSFSGVNLFAFVTAQ